MFSRILLPIIVLFGNVQVVKADSSNCVQSAGNYYCSKANVITYHNVGHAGVFDRVVDMNGCQTVQQAFSGSLAPFDEEVSLAFRGPLHLKYFAVYTLQSSTSNKIKRGAHAGHGHRHAHDHEKRSDIVIVATDGDAVFSWTTEQALAAGPTYAPTSVPATSAPNADSSADIQSSQPGYTPAPPASADSPTSAPAIAPTSTPVSSSDSASAAGDWAKVGCYNATQGSAEGLMFLKSYYGPMDYCAKNGTSTASAPEVLEDCLVPSNQEYTIWTDKKCAGQNGDCGYFNPAVPAYHGFGGSAKAFLFEFSMPHDGCNEGLAPDTPSIWILNSLIPRTEQYGCSCWESGCGELDLFEVLTHSDERMKATVHDQQSYGCSDWFARPVNGFAKAAVIMQNYSITIAMLPDDFDIGSPLTANEINQIHSMPATVDSLPN